jgi:hypothetical protein
MSEGTAQQERKQITGGVSVGEAGFSAFIQVKGSGLDLTLTDLTAAQLEALQELSASLSQALREHESARLAGEKAPDKKGIGGAPSATTPPASPRKAFQIGDPVRVIGGDGTELVVDAYDEAGGVVCSFWEGVKRSQATFPESALEKLPLSSPPPDPRGQ